jgi:hypothetical protein
MRKTLAGLMLVSAFVVTTSDAVLAAPHNEHGWGNDAVVTLQITHETAPSNGHPTPEYVIGPVDAAHPLNPVEDEFGPYDLVVQTPQHNHGTYSSHFRVFLVVPAKDPPATVASRDVQAGDDVIPLAYAADLGSGVTPLTSREKVEQAASLGLVDLVDTGINEICHIAGRA